MFLFSMIPAVLILMWPTLLQMTWQRLLKNTTAVAPAPPASMEMACWADGNCLCLFGGQNRDDAVRDEFEVSTTPVIRTYNTITKKWGLAISKVSIAAVPTVELECSAHRGFVFGGYWDRQSTPYVHQDGKISLLSSTYYQDMLFFRDGAFKLVACTNEPPQRRAGAAVFANVTREKCYVAFGYNTFSDSGISPFGTFKAFGDMFCCKMKKEGSVLNLLPCSWCDKPPADIQHQHSSCAACKQTRYCCKECQRLHWKASHKKECKMLQGN